MYDAASSILAQKLSQVSGVGQVIVGGGSLPTVRIELNPMTLNKYGIGFEQVRSVLSSANANTPKGHFSDGHRHVGGGRERSALQGRRLPTVDRGLPQRIGRAHLRYRPSGGSGPEDLRNAGYANGKPSVLVIIFRQPGANIIDTVDGIRAALPQLKAAIPQSIDMRVAMDQTVTIRASVQNVERTLDHLGDSGDSGRLLFSEKPADDLHPQHRRPRVADRNLRRDVPVWATAWTIYR